MKTLTRYWMLLPLLMLVSIAGAKPQNNIILYGGIGYTEEATQQTLFDLLTDGSYRLEDATEQMVIQLNRETGGLPQLSPYPVALLVDDAEAAIARELGKERAPFDSVTKLQRYSDRVLGIFLVGSFEQHMGFVYPYQLMNGTVRHSYHDYFFTSVTALLLDLENDEIVLSASALSQVHNKSAASQINNPKEQQQQFLKAYTQASDKALERLVSLIQTRNLNKIRDEDRHIVTGVWVNGSNAGQLFQWQQPGASPNMCNIPSGCKPGSTACAQMAGLLAHGTTDALSAKGLITLPPLGWSTWRSDNAWEVAARFALPQNRKSLTDRLIDFSINPKQAANKYIATIDDIDSATSANGQEALLKVDEYVTNLSLIKAFTPPDSCTPQRELEFLDDKAFYGLYQASRVEGRAKANPDQQRLFHQIALINALSHLPVKGN